MNTNSTFCKVALFDRVSRTSVMGNSLTKAVSLDVTVRVVVYLLSAYLQTENLYDLSGSGAFIYLLPFFLMRSGRYFPRQVIQSGMVATWAARLGVFLVCRALRDSSDTRYNKIRSNPMRLLVYSLLQGK